MIHQSPIRGGVPAPCLFFECCQKTDLSTLCAFRHCRRVLVSLCLPFSLNFNSSSTHMSFSLIPLWREGKGGFDCILPCLFGLLMGISEAGHPPGQMEMGEAREKMCDTTQEGSFERYTGWLLECTPFSESLFDVRFVFRFSLQGWRLGCVSCVPFLRSRSRHLFVQRRDGKLIFHMRGRGRMVVYF
uniref:Transmembrane protein n=1 Tax=Panagrellus redivivus TaxID=6233 RepID=A0A7E4VQM3_PANRE